MTTHFPNIDLRAIGLNPRIGPWASICTVRIFHNWGGGPPFARSNVENFEKKFRFFRKNRCGSKTLATIFDFSTVLDSRGTCLWGVGKGRP